VLQQRPLKSQLLQTFPPLIAVVAFMEETAEVVLVQVCANEELMPKNKAGIMADKKRMDLILLIECLFER
jgi:hypothetical protein